LEEGGNRKISYHGRSSQDEGDGLTQNSGNNADADPEEREKRKKFLSRQKEAYILYPYRFSAFAYNKLTEKTGKEPTYV
jgi:hypothetical protein